MRRSFVTLIAVTLFSLLASLLAACAGTPFGSGGATPDILATTTILADITRNVAGDRFSIGSLLPVGTDPHSYQPTPQDTAKLSKSKVLVINGAEYEHFLEPLLANTDGERTLIEASASLQLRSDLKSEHGVDPHAWLDPNNVIVYVENIRDGLIKFDPAGAETYQANADGYIKQLEELDAWINGEIVQIPPERRLLVTNHEALGYFAERYDFRVVGTVIESFSSDASPSAQQMAALVDQIKLFEAPAIFLDAADNPVLAQQIAEETGVKVITDLHLESLTDGAPAPTYIELMKSNVTTILEALQ
ncbi:MAG TPA: metal ABC transporter substrate-binding protein [Anaerolineales bacterium]|nr:metal ABC transporter substrate-binding protein [Anaerolineales bacterium]